MKSNTEINYSPLPLVLNATTLVMGGALQACVNFILEARNDASITWYFLISRRIQEQLLLTDQDWVVNNNVTMFNDSPAKSMYARKAVLAKTKEISPAAVFTFFGPSYVKFNCPHFLGFADPWVLNPNHYALAILPSIRKRIMNSFLCLYKRHWLKNADYWLLETEEAKRGLMKAIGCNEENVGVVPNGCRDIFKIISAREISGETDEIQLLCLSAYYPHKYFEIIPAVAKTLARLLPERRFSFVLTISTDDPPVKRIAAEAERLGVTQYIRFIGSVSLNKVPELYQSSHIAFIPTLLEVFSATYSESMSCRLPIVTSDFGFARSVCKDGAYYFKPTDANSAALTIVDVVRNKLRRDEILSRAFAVAKELPDAKKKYAMYKEFITEQLD